MAPLDDRYPFVYYDRVSDRGRMGVSLAQGDDFIRLTTLLENKPGGLWKVVDMTPDEAEQFALRILERVKILREIEPTLSETRGEK